MNIGDYSSPDLIPDGDKLIQFSKDFKSRVRNEQAVLYLTYGDVTAKDGAAMLQFTETFFRWIATISHTDATAMGRIGISFDVEHMSSEDTKTVLLRCQQLRKETFFGDANLLIQFTVEGDKNIVGTDYAFKYADSVLVMLYSNYMTSPTLPEKDNLYNKLKWLLTEQCPRCLDDAYSKANYKGKIMVMVEASCQMGRSCSWASFCAHDGPAGAPCILLIRSRLRSICSCHQGLSMRSNIRDYLTLNRPMRFTTLSGSDALAHSTVSSRIQVARRTIRLRRAAAVIEGFRTVSSSTRR